MMEAVLTFIEYCPLREQAREAELEGRIRQVLQADPDDPG
jgi:hypothetical protein